MTISAQPSPPTPGPDGIRFDPNLTTPARRYNALLGGKDNFAADRIAADQISQAFPDAHVAAVENRRFVLRMVRHLAQHHGIRQFLDLGCGMPTHTNVHNVAEGVHPDARAVYVDNDPLVAVHARALLKAGPQARAEFVDGDLRSPHTLLAEPIVRDTFDVGEPIAVLIMAVLHFIPDSDQPYKAVRTLMQALPAGSYLAISHGTADLLPDPIRAQLEAVAANSEQGTLVSRTRDQIAAFADGLELIGPGVTPIVDWLPALQPQPDPVSTPARVPCYGMLARAPR